METDSYYDFDFSHILESDSLLCHDRYTDHDLPFEVISMHLSDGLGKHCRNGGGVDDLVVNMPHRLPDLDRPPLLRNLQNSIISNASCYAISLTIVYRSSDPVDCMEGVDSRIHLASM